MATEAPQTGSFVVGDTLGYQPQGFQGQYGGQGGQPSYPYVASSYQPAQGSTQQYSSMAAGGYQFPQQSQFPAQSGYSQQGGELGQAPASYGLPSSGSFIAQPGYSPYPNAGHAGQPGFSNPFLAAMYGTLNGMGHDWATQGASSGMPDPRFPENFKSAAELAGSSSQSASALPRAAADGTPRSRDEARDTAVAQKGARADSEKRDRSGEKKRAVKEKKEQPGGFWFWSCS